MKNQINQVLTQLLDNRENNLSVKTQVLNLTNGSLGNPRIQVGTLPYYEWDNKKEITYIVCCGRFITCEMLVYEKMMKGYEFLKTTNKKEAKEYIKKYVNRTLKNQIKIS